MIKKTATTTAILLLLILTGCGIEYREDPKCEKYNYMTFEDFRASVAVEEPREIEEAGKIYLYGDTLLVNKKNKGIHIIDNSDKENPINQAFIKIYGNIDIAVKDGFMLVDSFMDLVVIDINNRENIQEVNRTKDIFPHDRYSINQDSLFDRGYYGCNFDLEKGLIIGVDND